MITEDTRETRESAKLDEILQQVSQHRIDFRVFQAELTGGEYDKSTARIPLLESTSKEHGKRITRLERFALMLVGAAGLLKVLAWGAASVSQVIEAVKR